MPMNLSSHPDIRTWNLNQRVGGVHYVFLKNIISAYLYAVSVVWTLL